MSYYKDVNRLADMYIHVMGMSQVEAIEKAYTELDKQHEQKVQSRGKKKKGFDKILKEKMKGSDDEQGTSH